jgi:hypothetical protein
VIGAEIRHGAAAFLGAASTFNRGANEACKRILKPSFRRVRGIPILFAGVSFTHGNLQRETTGRLTEGLKNTTFLPIF